MPEYVWYVLVFAVAVIFSVWTYLDMRESK